MDNKLVRPDISCEITGEDLLRSEAKSIPFLLDPILQQTGLACLAGSSDTGKSTFLRQLAVAIVSGEKEFLGFTINAKHKSVIFVATEDDINATRVLLKKHVNGKEALSLRRLRFLFETDNLVNELDRRLTSNPADLVILDCFSDAFGQNLNDTHLIRNYLNIFQRLASKHECLIILLHHTGKRTEQFAPNKNNLLGGQGFEAKMRVVFELRNDFKSPVVKHFCIVKGNYIPSAFKTDSYVLKFDENSLSFYNTGKRIPFNKLTNAAEEKQIQRYLLASQLKKQGLSHVEIADKVGLQTKGAVSKILSKGEENGWEPEE